MAEQEVRSIAVRQVDESLFRLFIDGCGAAVLVTEDQLRNVVAIALIMLVPDDPAIDAVVVAAREDEGFRGELHLDSASAQSVARQMKLYRERARASGLRSRRDAMRLLVVDDDPAVAQVIREILVHEGHAADVVHTGADAIRQARGDGYDALILDVRMPDMSGLDVFEALRTLDCRLAHRTVFIGANYVPAMEKTLTAVGRSVLKKPFEVTDLVAALRGL